MNARTRSSPGGTTVRRSTSRCPHRSPSPPPSSRIRTGRSRRRPSNSRSTSAISVLSARHRAGARVARSRCQRSRHAHGTCRPPAWSASSPTGWAGDADGMPPELPPSRRGRSPLRQARLAGCASPNPRPRRLHVPGPRLRLGRQAAPDPARPPRRQHRARADPRWWTRWPARGRRLRTPPTGLSTMAYSCSTPPTRSNSSAPNSRARGHPERVAADLAATPASPRRRRRRDRRLRLTPATRD